MEIALPKGTEAVYAVIIDALADAVEFRHDPPAPNLDGWRTRSDSADYLRLELIAFPRAFQTFTATFSRPVVEGDWVRVPAVHWTGVLNSATSVDVGMELGLQVADTGVCTIFGGTLPGTRKEDLIAWLKAVAAAGGFNPAPGRTEGRS